MKQTIKITRLISYEYEVTADTKNGLTSQHIEQIKRDIGLFGMDHECASRFGFQWKRTRIDGPLTLEQPLKIERIVCNNGLKRRTKKKTTKK